MVFVRVHVKKNYLSAEQKRELGDRLIAAVAQVEELQNTERHQQTSWVQYYELEPENWYGPVTLGDPAAFWQIDMIAPEKLLPTREGCRQAVEKVTEAVRQTSGEGLLPARGPWVQIYVIPDDQWGIDGIIPNWDGARQYFASTSSDEAERALDIFYGREQRSA